VLFSTRGRKKECPAALRSILSTKKGEERETLSAHPPREVYFERKKRRDRDCCSSRSREEGGGRKKRNESSVPNWSRSLSQAVGEEEGGKSFLNLSCRNEEESRRGRSATVTSELNSSTDLCEGGGERRSAT